MFSFLRSKPLIRSALQRLLFETASHFYKPLSAVVVARAALSPALDRLVNAVLRWLPGFEGHVDRVSFQVLHPGIRLEGFSLRRMEQGVRQRFVEIPLAVIRFSWPNLLQQRCVFDVELERPVVYIDVGRAASATQSRPVQLSWQERIQKFPFLMSRLLVRHGTVHFYNVPDQGPVDLAISDLFLVLKNVTTSLLLAPTQQARFEVRARALQSGRLNATGMLYPFAAKPTFDIDLQLRDLELRPLNPLFRAHLGTEVKTGTLDAFAEMAADTHGYKGYVKPLFEQLRLHVVRYDNWIDSLKDKLLHAMTRLLKNKRVDRIATRIAFSGDWIETRVATWAAAGEFLKNAFRTAFRPSLENSIRFARMTDRNAFVDIHFYKRPETRLQKGFALIKEAAARWSEDHATRMSAALSYYATFSLAPLLILIIAVAGLAFGREAAAGHVFDQLAGLIDPKTAMAIQDMIHAAWKPTKGVVATLLSLLTLFFGSLGVLLELKRAMNRIWRIPKSTGIGALLRDRIRSLGLILGVGFLMVVSLVISAAISALGEYLGHRLPMPAFMMQTINTAVSFVIIMGLFAMIFKWLPDTHIDWRDVWTGSAVTSFLFTIGKLAFGHYIGGSGIRSSYGAAGSVVIILMWVYYSAMILYFGSEFTAVFAERHGSRRTDKAL